VAFATLATPWLQHWGPAAVYRNHRKTCLFRRCYIQRSSSIQCSASDARHFGRFNRSFLFTYFQFREVAAGRHEIVLLYSGLWAVQCSPLQTRGAGCRHTYDNPS